MNSLRFYKTASVVLLLLNVAMLTFFFLTRPKPHMSREDGKKMIISSLKLNKQQHTKFVSLANTHLRQLEQYDEQQRALLRPYFNRLVQGQIGTDSKDAILDILTLERGKIESTYKHLQDVQNLLKPEQIKGFDEFVQKAVGRILYHKNNKALPPKEF